VVSLYAKKKRPVDGLLSAGFQCLEVREKREKPWTGGPKDDFARILRFSRIAASGTANLFALIAHPQQGKVSCLIT
jgi:hypothetical protein